MACSKNTAAPASSRRTTDTDFITLRTVYAKYPDNSTIPGLRALTSDGSGGTAWIIPSSFGTNPSFNQIITSGGTYTADLSFNTFQLYAGQGIGMTPGQAGLNQTYIYAKAFDQVKVDGGDTLYAYSNNTLTPSMTFATNKNNYIQLATNSDTNTLIINGPMTQTISTGYYGFNKFIIVPTVSTIQTNLSAYNQKTLFADSQSTQITFAGVKDLILSTSYSTNQVFFSLSSFTASGYLGISGEAFSVYNRLLSTISSGFVTLSNFSTGAIALSTLSFSNASTVTSTILGVSSVFGDRFITLTGLINARATIAQLNDTTTNFQVALSSFSTNYMSFIDYTSSATGILSQISTTIFLSSISTIYVYNGTFTNFSAGSITYDPNDISTLSTATNSRIISTANTLNLQNEGNLLSTFSTVLGLGTLGYVSSTQLFSTVRGLGSLGYVSSTQLTSTVEGLGTLGYISTSQLISTVQGLGTLNYISSSYSDSLLQSTTKGIQDNLGSYSYISSASLTSSLQSTTQGLVDSLGSFGYISTAQLISTTTGLYETFGQFYVSTAGLNTILQSSIEGLGTIGYISTDALDQSLTSSFNAIFTYNLISSPNLESTITHLGSMGYVSTATMLSSFNGQKLSMTNIRSSIIYTGNNGSQTMTTLADDTYYFSSASVNLDVFSSFIINTSRISFDINVNLFFEGAGSGTGTNNPAYSNRPNTYSFSTILQYNTIMVTTYTDSFFGQRGSNNYGRMITLDVDNTFLQNNYTGRYNIVHRVGKSFGPDVGADPADTFGVDDSTAETAPLYKTGVSVLMASTNSLFLTILNP